MPPPPPPPPPPHLISPAPVLYAPAVLTTVPRAQDEVMFQNDDALGEEAEEAEEAEEEEADGSLGGSPRQLAVTETLEYEESEESKKARERKEQLVQQLLMHRRASALAVPTNDAAVRIRLRSLQQPITLFGEREMERRDRLRAIMAKLDADGELEKLVQAQEASGDAAVAGQEDAADQAVAEEVPLLQLFYTEGPTELFDARTEILKFSLSRAQSRIESAKRKRADPDEDEDLEFEEALQAMTNTSMDCSEIGDGRPLSACAFSADASLLATR
jgi:U4/U6 small nuclear ribonucleoprotein PRP4